VTHTLETFPSRNYDKLRFGDTDKFGHVNNAAFVTFFETGRTALFDDAGVSLNGSGYIVVLARMTMDFLAEILWPGTVEVGSGVAKLGRSSITVRQALFQNGKCVATAEGVVVLVDAQTHRPVPMDDDVRKKLTRLLLDT
jgi:acyl-CoA thioester hydrolase